MPYVCGLDCNWVRNDSQIIWSKIQRHVFSWVGKNLTTEKNHICGTFWTDEVVSEKLILFFLAISVKFCHQPTKG